MGFVALVLATMLDPVVFLAAVGARIFARTVRRFLVIFALAAPATHLLVSALLATMSETRTLGDVVFSAPGPRLLAFLIVMATAAGVAALVRRLRARNRP